MVGKLKSQIIAFLLRALNYLWLLRELFTTLSSSIYRTSYLLIKSDSESLDHVALNYFHFLTASLNELILTNRLSLFIWISQKHLIKLTPINYW